MQSFTEHNYSLASFSFNLFVLMSPTYSHSELQLVIVVHEVAEAHKRTALIREVAAHARGVAAGAGVEQHAELVVADVFVLAADLAEVLLQWVSSVSHLPPCRSLDRTPPL